MPDAHYTHSRLARLYDLDSPWGADTNFYMSLVGPTRARVLDLGCGTGTLCSALADAGHEVTGVDPAAAMLSVARNKPRARNIEWLQSSAQHYRSGKLFDVIVMTGHAFQVLLTETDVLAAFATMRRHLASDGIVAFESRNPKIDWDEEWARSVEWDLPDGKVHQTRSALSITRQLISFEHTYQFPDETLVSANTLRFMNSSKIKALLSKSGFQTLHVYGDWDSSLFDERSSKEMIFVARAKAKGTHAL